MPFPSKRAARAAAKKGVTRRSSMVTRNRQQRDEHEAGRKLAQKLLARPKFRRNFEKNWDDCKVHPSIVNQVMCFAFGRPTEYREETPVVPVRIEHVYATAKDPE